MGRLYTAKYGSSKQDVVELTTAADYSTVGSDDLAVHVGANAAKNHAQINTMVQRCVDALREDGLPMGGITYRGASLADGGAKSAVAITDDTAFSNDGVAVLVGNQLAKATGGRPNASLLFDLTISTINKARMEAEKKL